MNKTIQFNFYAILNGEGNLVNLDPSVGSRVTLFTDVTDVERERKALGRRDPLARIVPVQVATLGKH
jgi:hypothetical protein